LGRLVCLATVLGVLGGCGDNIRMFDSGTRLEALIETGGAGSEVLAYFHDHERDEDCVFAQDRTGQWRCMPRLRAVVVGYTDSMCTAPIYRCDACAPGDTQVTVEELGCTEPIAVAHELTPAESPLFVLALNGICVPVTAPPDAYYTVTPLPDDPYVLATFEDRDVGDGLGARSLVTADGAREMHHAYALEDRRSCTFLGGPGQPHPCLPGTPARTELGLVYFFDNDTCSTRVAHTIRRDECEPTTHVRVENVAHTVVRELPAAAFERSPIDSSCSASERDFRFWEIGPVDESLPTAELITIGAGEVRPVYYAALGSPVAFANRWVDELNHTCLPTGTLRGRRCLPRFIPLPVPADASFYDAACEHQIVYNPEDATHGAQFDGALVGSLHPLTRYAGTEVFARIGGVCTALTDPPVLMSHVGPSVDLLGLPELTLRSAGF